MKTKQLLKEWKQFLNEAAVIPLKLIKLQVRNSREIEGKELDETLQDLDSNWDSIYKKYSNVISNDLNKTKEPISHILSAIKSFSVYYSSCDVEYKEKISRGQVSASDLRAFYESKQELKKKENRTKNRIACRKKANLSQGFRWSEGSSNKTRDFEVIYSDSDWVVIYPLSLLGSISWAVGLADASEEKYELDKNGTQIGRVNWCTASYENNRFPMYAGDLHMYYFIKNNGYNINSYDRRLCISLSKKSEDEIYSEEEEVVEIRFDKGATVNAENSSDGVSSLEEIKATVNNDEIIDLIKSHASTKNVTSIKEMASRVTLPILKQDEIMLAEDPESLNQQIAIYLENTKEDEIIDYIIENYKDTQVLHDELLYDYGSLLLSIFMRKDINRLCKEKNIVDKYIRILYNESDKFQSDIHDMWVAIIYADNELGKNILEINNNLHKMFDFGIDDRSEFRRFGTTGPIQEYILAKNGFMYCSELLYIFNKVLKNPKPSDFTANGFFIALLNVIEEIDRSDPLYNEVKNVIRKSIYPKGDDALKRIILSKFNYVFENSLLRSYIKLLLN